MSWLTKDGIDKASKRALVRHWRTNYSKKEADAYCDELIRREVANIYTAEQLIDNHIEHLERMTKLENYITPQELLKQMKSSRDEDIRLEESRRCNYSFNTIKASVDKESSYLNKYDEVIRTMEKTKSNDDKDNLKHTKTTLTVTNTDCADKEDTIKEIEKSPKKRKKCTYMYFEDDEEDKAWQQAVIDHVKVEYHGNYTETDKCDSKDAWTKRTLRDFFKPKSS